VAASSFLSLRSSGNIEVLNGRLLEAGRNVDHGKISSLLIQGANINAVTRDRGRNILHKIFKHAKPEDVGKVADAVKLVLDKGGDINLFDTKGATPLMLAKKYGWLDQTQVRSVIAQNIPDIEKQLRVSDANSSDVVATFIQNQQDELHERVAFML
jgi:ankyrin repeat protein